MMDLYLINIGNAAELARELVFNINVSELSLAVNLIAFNRSYPR